MTHFSSRYKKIQKKKIEPCEITLYCIHYVTNYFVTYCIRNIYIVIIDRNTSSNLMNINTFCLKMKENAKYRLKSPERTTSISVIEKLLWCVLHSTGKNEQHENIHENICQITLLHLFDLIYFFSNSKLGISELNENQILILHRGIGIYVFLG